MKIRFLSIYLIASMLITFYSCNESTSELGGAQSEYGEIAPLTNSETVNLAASAPSTLTLLTVAVPSLVLPKYRYSLRVNVPSTSAEVPKYTAVSPSHKSIALHVLRILISAISPAPSKLFHFESEYNLSAPGKIGENLVVDEVVNLRDVFATLLDYSNVSTNNSDGTSLRRFIEKANYNKDFDEEHIVSEWDFRDPSGTSLLRSLGGEINFLSMKGDYKLMMTKKASSGKIDMMYDIGTDPYELDNLIGEDGNTASDFVIGKTEHLKALLIDWMTRMDGADKLYSDSKWNNFEGAGDIAEIRMRRTWRAMDLWLGDTAVYFGTSADVEGTLTRNEYLYLGRTSDGTATVSSVSVEGADAAKFTVSEFVSGAIAKDSYKRIKIQYLPATMDEEIDAKLRIVHSTGDDILVSLGRRTYGEGENVDGKLPGTPTLIYPGIGMQGMKVSLHLCHLLVNDQYWLLEDQWS